MSNDPTRKPLVGQNKPMNAPVFSSTRSSKKQKVSRNLPYQFIEQLNDFTAVTGINLREEEEQLFSGPKQDGIVPKASQEVFHVEEGRAILNKIPLRKRVLEIIARSGLKGMSNELEQILSLCVEARLRGLIINLIRLSKQKVDTKKAWHSTLITSDIRQQIMAINLEIREESKKTHTQTEKSQKPNEPESSTTVDSNKRKDESQGKKEEHLMRHTAAANVALADATGVDDMMSRWKQMTEVKRNPAVANASSGSQPASASYDSALIGNVRRNQILEQHVARTITVKDVIAVLEREHQMSKSTLIYKLYNMVKS